MKTWKIFWGLGFILVAVALVLDAVGVLAPVTSAIGNVSIIACVAALLLLSYVISELVKGRIANIFLPLALIFLMFEKNIAFVIGHPSEDIINNWLVIGCAALLWIGFAILLSGHRKRKRFKVIHHTDEDHSHHRSSNLASSIRYIDCEGFENESVENNIGSLTINFENVDKYAGGGVLEVENNLGHLQINVPEGWHIDVKIENSLGVVRSPENNADGPTLTITGENNLGDVRIERV